LGAAAIGSSSRGGALPPLSAGDSLQQSITAPTGPLAGMAAGVPASALAAAQGVELPTPRRLTGSLGSNKARGETDTNCSPAAASTCSCMQGMLCLEQMRRECVEHC
jgi:hypothetical protein